MNLLKMLIDTHCHLNDKEAFPDPGKAILEAMVAGVERIIVVGVDTDSSAYAVELADRYEQIFSVVGWHPNYAANYKPSELKKIEELLTHDKVLAIGEIGLDFHWDYATLEQQELSLQDHLALARQTQKPVVFHCRKAYPNLLSILEKEPAHPYLFHCFSGDSNDATRAQALDAYFGVDGPITYPKAADLRELVKTLPENRIVIETDSPWLTPQPHRGKPNKPAFLPLVHQALAKVLGMSYENCAKRINENARDFFKLPHHRVDF